MISPFYPPYHSVAPAALCSETSPLCLRVREVAYLIGERARERDNVTISMCVQSHRTAMGIGHGGEGWQIRKECKVRQNIK